MASDESGSPFDVYNMTMEQCMLTRTIVECNRCFEIEDIPSWLLYIHAVVLIAVVAVTMVGNGLVVTLLFKFKKLRHRTAMFSVSVISANTVLVFVYHVPVVVSAVSKKWQFGFVGCQVVGYLSFGFILTRWLTLAGLSIDRFCVVRFPFSYPRCNKHVLVMLFIISWVLPVLLTAATLIGGSNVKFRANLPSCLLYAPPNQRVYFGVVFTTTFILGGVMPLLLYIWLLHKARKMRNSLYRIERPQDRSTSRGGNEKAVFVTFSLIFTAFCLTGLLMYFFRVIRSLSYSSWCNVPIIVHFAVVDLFLSSTAVDPLLIMRDRDFRKRLRHLLCCHNDCGRYYVNRSDICPELPPERDFDAIRTVMIKALNLASSVTSGCSSERPATRSYRRPRSASAPAVYLSQALGELYKPQLPDMVEESEGVGDRKRESCVGELAVDLSSWVKIQREAVRAENFDQESDCNDEKVEQVEVNVVLEN